MAIFTIFTVKIVRLILPVENFEYNMSYLESFALIDILYGFASLLYVNFLAYCVILGHAATYYDL